MPHINFDPNASETEADGTRAEAVRRLKVRKLFSKPTENGEKYAKLGKDPVKKDGGTVLGK